MKYAILAALMVMATPVTALSQDKVAAASLPNAFDRTQVAATPIAVTPVMADERSEPALRAFIEGAGDGQVDTTVLSDELVAAIGAQSDRITPLIRSFGPVQAVTFIGHKDDTDRFSVLFANADTQWVIGFDETGKIAALLFRPTPAE